MDITTVTGLLALMALCYLAVILTGTPSTVGAPIATKRERMSVPAASSLHGFGAAHGTPVDADDATRVFGFSNPQLSDRCTVWRPPPLR